MRNLLSTARLVAIGAVAMYYLDPNRGRARRARVADQMKCLAHDGQRYLRITLKRGTDRSRGLAAGFTSRLSREPVDDVLLEARVRSRLGRLVRHPGSIETEVRGGRLRLRGPVLARELNGLMAGLWRVPGLVAIDSELRVHEHTGREPGLQGERRPGRRPSRPLLPAVLGAGALALGSLRRGTPLRAGSYTAATALLLAAWLNPAGPRQRAAQRADDEVRGESETPIPPPVRKRAAERYRMTQR